MNITINGKTPEEIKKGHECCASGSCLGCPYRREKHCVTQMKGDVNAYIQQLESRLAQAERERDALIKHVQGKCHACKHARGYPNKGMCSGCKHTFHAKRESTDNWQWRGVCPENTKEET